MPTLLLSSNSTMNSNNGPIPQQKYKVNEKVIVRCSEPGENDGYFDYEAIVVSYNANDGTYDIVFSYDNKRDTGVKEDVMKNFEDLKVELTKGIKILNCPSEIRFRIGDNNTTMRKDKQTHDLSIINFVMNHFDNPQISKFKAFIRIVSTINLQIKANEKFFKRLLDATFETVNLFTNYGVLEKKGKGFLRNGNKFSKIIASMFIGNKFMHDDVILLKDRMCDFFTKNGIIDKTILEEQMYSCPKELNSIIKDIDRCEKQMSEATYEKKKKKVMERKLNLEKEWKAIQDFGKYIQKCSVPEVSIISNKHIKNWLQESSQLQQSKLQDVTYKLDKLTEIESNLKEEIAGKKRKLKSELEQKKREKEIKMNELKSLELQQQQIVEGEHDRYWRKVARKRAEEDARLARERAEEDAKQKKRAHEHARMKEKREEKMGKMLGRKHGRSQSFENVAQNNDNSPRISKRINRSCTLSPSSNNYDSEEIRRGRRSQKKHSSMPSQFSNGAFTTTTTTSSSSSSSSNSSSSSDSNSLSLSRNDVTPSRSPSTYKLNNHDADGATKSTSTQNRRGWGTPLQTWMSGRPKLF